MGFLKACLALGLLWLAGLFCVGTAPVFANAQLEVDFQLVSDSTTYYANTTMLFEFAITNRGDDEFRFWFSEPFKSSLGGFYIEGSRDGGAWESYSSGWHELGRGLLPSEKGPTPSGLRVKPKEKVTWKNYSTKTPEGYRVAFDAGSYKLRARLRDRLLDFEAVSSEIEIHILPPPPGEEEAREDFAKYFPGLMERLDRWPDSVYTRHFLNYLAWVGEELAAEFGTGPNSLFLVNALECRRRLREKYPDWMYNDEGLYREAAVRVKVAEPEKAVELLETLVRDYPESPQTPKAQAILPEIRDLVGKQVKHDHASGTMTIQEKVELFNLNGPERSKVE